MTATLPTIAGCCVTWPWWAFTWALLRGLASGACFSCGQLRSARARRGPGKGGRGGGCAHVLARGERDWRAPEARGGRCAARDRRRPEAAPKGHRCPSHSLARAASRRPGRRARALASGSCASRASGGTACAGSVADGVLVAHGGRLTLRTRAFTHSHVFARPRWKGYSRAAMRAPTLSAPRATSMRSPCKATQHRSPRSACSPPWRACTAHAVQQIVLHLGGDLLALHLGLLLGAWRFFEAVIQF